MILLSIFIICRLLSKWRDMCSSDFPFVSACRYFRLFRQVTAKAKKWRLRVCESMAIYCYVYILSTKHVSRCILKLKIFLTIICMRNESDLFTWTVVKARQHTPCGTTQWQWGRTIEHCICLFRIRWKCCLHECAVISQFWLSHYVTSTPFLSSSVNNVILLCMLIS